ncbi:MAG TPA: DegT/DnrJ/EryC1/StrS family aminotransferase [Pyrinomonadaceae bacterium]|nr:DegT/DnrJ/EryC1/StrS family aminotransferase [Pyrinomonadaceae bacterium]
MTEQVLDRPIPLMDMVAQYRTIQTEIDAAVRQVLEAGQFILGPNVAALEKEIAAYIGVERGVGVASGTDALVLALRALEIGPGDEVIVPAYTFFATAGAVLLVGAKPVCVEVDPQTYTLDVEQISSRLTEKTKAIIPVHLYGHPADMTAVMKLAESRGLKVIEDNAQAIGAQYQGRKTGSIGDIACLSFFPSKNLGGYGDGGMVITNDDDLADRIRMLRTHGWRKKYFPEMLGYNSRLDELQAAILRVKLRHLDEWTERRQFLAGKYNEQFAGTGIGTPFVADEVKHAYHLYIIDVDNRPQVQAQLKEEGIPTAVYYPQPLHLAEPLADYGYKNGDFPVSERASERTLSIPFYPEMGEEQLRAVAEKVKRIVRLTLPNS